MTTESALDALNLPDAGALAPAWPADGLAAPALEITVKTIGLSRDGNLYLYGPTATEPGPLVANNAICGLVISAAITTGSSAKYGERDYLDLRLATPTPGLQLLLKLPCGANQWSYRSLLGALTSAAGDLDLCAQALRIGAKRGKETTFLTVATDPEGTQIIRAAALEPGRDALEIAVNALRRALGQPPQFL